MSFQPIVPIGGYAGWKFLQTTLPRQTESFRADAQLVREVDHARTALGSVIDAEQLVADRQLLKVALGAFGLQDDLPNKAFIEKILSDGTSDPAALSNRLADKRYRAFADAFGLSGTQVPGTLTPGFVDEVVEDYQTRAFEIAVGEQSTEMRLAFTFEREIGELAAQPLNADTMWFSVMGNPPLRSMFETALGLPDGFGALDIDQQLGVFRDRLERFTGDGELSQFTDATKKEDFVRLFLLRADLENGPGALTPGMGALTLLSNMQRPSASLLQTALLA